MPFYFHLPPTGLLCLLNGFNFFRLHLSNRLVDCYVSQQNKKITLILMQLISTKRDHKPSPSYHLHTLRYRFSSPYANLSFLSKSFFTHLAASGVNRCFYSISLDKIRAIFTGPIGWNLLPRTRKKKRAWTIRFGHRLVLTNFLIEYSVFTVITLWQYISLPNTPPCLGFQWDTCKDVLKMSI